jgi:V8-like Glu-specific endopeptidase
LTRFNNLNSIGKGRIYYDIDIPSDFSGAPVYLYKNNSKLVGIDKSNLHNKRLNVATMVTQLMNEAIIIIYEKNICQK